jgi:elongation factor Ts
MAMIIEMIKQLREATGAGVLECRQALEQCNANYSEALTSLQEKAAAQADKRADRQTPQGVIEVYSHGNGRMGVMVEVNCETDFAARSATFRSFAHEIALQVAAAAPGWVCDDEIPPDRLREEAERAAARARAEGKPEALIPRITEGYLKKFKDQQVLLRQVSIRDEGVTVAQMLAQAAAHAGEKVVIRRFSRWELDGEAGN